MLSQEPESTLTTNPANTVALSGENANPIGSDNTTRAETALPNSDVLSLDIGPRIAQYKQQASTTLNADGAKAIIGTSGRDVIYGDETVRFINGDAGSDLIYGSAKNDHIDGDFNASVSGNQGNADIILGGDGNDSIRGMGGHDVLFGDTGNDTLQGGFGNDILWGGSGNDRLIGDGYFQSGGQDTFVVARSSGTDTIVDFQVGVDRIGLAGDLALEHLEFSQQPAGDTVIRDQISGGDIAILKGVNAGEINSDSFVTSQPDMATKPELGATSTPKPKANAAPAADSLVTLAMVDAKTNAVVPGYEDLSKVSAVDLKSLDLNEYSIKAVVNSDHELAGTVESIKFESNLGQRVESLVPYAIFGDRGGNFRGKAIETGDVTLKATAYSADNGKGKAIDTVDLSYTVVDTTDSANPTAEPAPTEPQANPTPAAPKPTPQKASAGKETPLVTLALVNAKTDKVVSGYEDLSTVDGINLDNLDLNEYNIAAVVNPDHELAATVESIKFESNLGQEIQSGVPYAMFGDRSNGDFNGKPVQAGDVSIKATAYSADGAKGEQLETVELDYAVTGTPKPAKSTPESEPISTPVPETGPKSANSGNTLWSDDFSGNWKGDWDLQQRGQWGLENFKVQSDAKGGNFLRVRYPKGSASPAVSRSNGVSLGGGEFKADLGVGPKDAMRLSYDVRFSDNFDFVRGGKLPGLFGGNAPSGGDNPNGRDGFSSRMMWRENGKGEVYAYLPTSRNYGTSIGKGKWSFNPGQWHNVQQEVILNDPGKSNGTIRVLFDDKLVHEEKNVLFRTTDSLKVDGLYFSSFFGGGDRSWSTPKDVHADFANFSVSEVKK